MKYRLPAILISLALNISARANAEPAPDVQAVKLTVSVFNDAVVPAPVLSASQARATAIFLRAGVTLSWLDCGSPGHRIPNSGCSDISFPEHLSVRLVPNVRPASGETFGQSFLNSAGEGSYASVYVDPLASSQAAERVHEGELLGCVSAHELGHLLLGRDSHSPYGLMSAIWRTSELREAARGNLFFTGGQSERIRSRYLEKYARWRAPAVPPASHGN